MHNRPTKKDIDDSYFGDGDISLSGEELSAVADLIDDRTNSKHLTAYMSDSSGMLLKCIATNW